MTTTSTAYQTEIDENDLWMRDIYIGHNYMEDIGQGAIDLCDAKNALVEYNVVDGFLRRYPSFRPTVALYPWKCENAIFQYNEVFNGPSTNADGSPYDMDSGLVNVVYQFNYSHNNPCGWMLYMGKMTMILFAIISVMMAVILSLSISLLHVRPLLIFK